MIQGVDAEWRAAVGRVTHWIDSGWKPVYHVLAGTVEVFIGNAHELRSRPGKKTDKRDAAWIAELLRHGLLRGSFIPSKPQRQLRELTRYRSTLVQDCEVCCNPWRVRVSGRDDERVVEVARADGSE